MRRTWHILRLGRFTNSSRLIGVHPWKSQEQANGSFFAILHIHLSGINYGPKGEKNHLVMEEADLDFRNLLRALHDSGAGGRLLSESLVMEVDALKFKALWLEMSGEA